MNTPLNCWEYQHCGREPGGDKVGELGVCPAATSVEFAGLNHGRNAGRICWAVAGTLCAGKVQGLFAMKIENCIRCPFFNLVEIEEEDSFVLHPEQGVIELP